MQNNPERVAELVGRHRSYWPMAVVRTLLLIVVLVLGWVAVRTDAVAHMIALTDTIEAS